MGEWKKYFADGTTYSATDEDVATKRSSWSKSRNEGIIRVDLTHAGTRISVQGPGQYWQADTYEVAYPGHSHQIIKRCIMKKLEPSDFYFHYQVFSDGVLLNFDKRATGVAQLVPSSVGKWIVLEMNLKSKQISHYYKDSCQ
jgi:hypothetical protein